MKKLLVLVLVAFFFATCAYALNETAENGPQNITACYMIGTSAVTSGNVVVLTDAGDTTRTIEYDGAEVTYSTTSEEIYGVIVDTRNFTEAQMAQGQWIRVQTYGYNDSIAVTQGSGPITITAGYGLLTDGGARSGAAGNTIQGRAARAGNAAATSNAVAFTAPVGSTGQTTIEGWLNW